MGKTGGHYANWNKPVTEGRILYDSTYVRENRQSHRNRAKNGGFLVLEAGGNRALYSEEIAQLVKNPSAVQETPVPLLCREDLLEKESLPTPVFLGFPGDPAGKESTCNVGGSIPGLGRSSGEGNSYPLQFLSWRVAWTV